MILDILNSICKEIVNQYPNHPIYIEKMPIDFKRPSFFVQLVAGDEDELTINDYMNNYTFQVVYFGEYDKYGDLDIENQLKQFSILQDIFSIGYLRILDTSRVAKITHLSISKRDDEIYIDLDLSITGVKNIPKDAEDNDMYMGELKLNYNN